jgi:hypothetical protein
MKLDVGSILVFDPESFESSRLSDDGKSWFYSTGTFVWRGKATSFVKLAYFDSDPPLGKDVEVLMEDVSGWNLARLGWCNVPCDPSSCMLIVKREGAYVKMLPLSVDYKPPENLEDKWFSVAVLEYGSRTGLLRAI